MKHYKTTKTIAGIILAFVGLILSAMLNLVSSEATLKISIILTLDFFCIMYILTDKNE